MSFYVMIYLTAQVFCSVNNNYLREVYNILQQKSKKRISFIILLALVFNVLGIIPSHKEVKASTIPKMTSVEMVDKSPQVGTYPTLKLSSKGSPSVQYSVYLYSPSKKVWENVSGGYTAAVNGNGTYSIKLKKPLHEGENSFSIWVKKAGAPPTDKGGYDDFKSYKVTVNNGSSQKIPTIKSASINAAEQMVGVKPNLKVSSNGDGKVQYRVFLYSPSKKVWEDVTNGYTAPVDAATTVSLKLSNALHQGENSFSIWVKRSNQSPINKEGYDNFLSYKINVNSSGSSDPGTSGDLPSIKSASIDASQQKVGVKPILKLTSTGTEDVQYRVYLYSPSKKVWEDISGGYTSAKSPSTTYNLQSNTALHEGENSFSIWVKRNGKTPANKEGYDNFLSYKINANKDSSEGTLPTVKSASIDQNQQRVGVKPVLKLTSTGTEDVQYRAFLYSPSKKVWEDISGGYTSAKNPSDVYNLQSNTALHEGENSFSIWVKRNGKTPANKEGYDNFLSYRINATKDASEEVLPTVKSASIDLSEQKVGIIPTLKLSSTGTEDVQYRAFLYSPSKKVWEDISGGYTSGKNPSTIYNLKANTHLHEGENSFSIWVKRNGKTPANKEGYDNFLSYKINVTEKSNTIPKITSVNISSEIELGGMPTITLKSSADTNVQYNVHLYSQSKGTWDDVSGGYTSSVSPGSATNIKINKPLQPGRNTFSIWVKRAGQAPSDPGGYDSYVQEVVNVYIPTEKTAKISNVSYDTNKIAVGTKPALTATTSAGDGSNISYKAFLYSNSQRKWLDASSYTDPIKGGSSAVINLNTPLEAGTNKVMLWAKRAWLTGEVYEDYKIVEIDAIKPAPMKKKIVVDAGHGGKDPGAVSSSGTKERDIALSVSLKLGDILKSKGYDVIYTRLDNNNVNWDSTNQSASLKYRTDFANSNGADMFVSIHCNSGGGSGTETYYSSRNPNKDKALATSIQNELVKAIGLRDRGAKSGNFYVVNNTNMTASLVELAFIDNVSEESKLKDSAFQQKAANGIANGIFKYLGN